MTTADPRLVDRFHREGYVVIPGALEPERLQACRAAFARVMAPIIAAKPDALVHEATRIMEREPAFAELMDHQACFPIARALLGADITLATAGEAYHKAPGTKSFIGWHNDFQWLPGVQYPLAIAWVRCAYFLEDIDETTAPITLLPGSHREPRPCPDLNDADGQPLPVPGQVALTGKAGDCVIMHSEIWHTNTANRGTRPRQLVMVLYKHAWMRQWEDGFDVTRAFAESQSDPGRRQLCNLGVWHRINKDWAF